MRYKKRMIGTAALLIHVNNNCGGHTLVPLLGWANYFGDSNRLDFDVQPDSGA